MSTGDPNTTSATPETAPAADAPAKPAAVKKPKKAAKKPAAKTAKPAAAKQVKKIVKKTAANKTSAKKTVKKAETKKTSQRGKGPANLRNKLHEMLLKKLPEKFRFDKQSLDFVKIAAAQKMTVEGVYKWFRSDRVTPVGVMNFVTMGGGKVKLADFHPFVFKK
jgi:hypothetical protein